MTSKCVANECKIKCASDTTCTPMGQLCDLTQGICVQCVGANDCKPDQFCSNGSCAPDVCKADSTSCLNNAVVTCRADGSGYGSPVACGSQACVATGATATCKDRIARRRSSRAARPPRKSSSAHPMGCRRPCRPTAPRAARSASLPSVSPACARPASGTVRVASPVSAA